MRITVYTSSSDAVASGYVEAARAVGRALADAGHELVYGGTAIGLMGAVAAGVREGGGRVTGVVPELMAARGLTDVACDEVIVTADMASRKATMLERGEAYLALPGGFGTLEEFFEALTLKQLGVHDRPVVLYDHDGFWQPLLALFQHLFDERFAKPAYAELYAVLDSVDGLLDHLAGYTPPDVPTKWF
ncbi:MAG: TIGR00730 family Rossman fold protein [Nitriliruptoraceae bacterium]|nr:TIGR00730 family Rossman fold protein [Nitriliruptoraceae bacterium]